jgi:hypothetical protein
VILRGIPATSGSVHVKKIFFSSGVGAEDLRRYGFAKWGRRSVDAVRARGCAATINKYAKIGGGNVKTWLVS